MGLHIIVYRNEHCEEHAWESLRHEKDRHVGPLLERLRGVKHPDDDTLFRPESPADVILIAKIAAQHGNPEHRDGHPRYLSLARMLQDNTDLWIRVSR